MTRFLILLLSMKFKKTGIILVSRFLTMFIFCNTTMVQVLLKVGYWKYEKWEYCEGPYQFFYYYIRCFWDLWRWIFHLIQSCCFLKGLFSLRRNRIVQAHSTTFNINTSGHTRTEGGGKTVKDRCGGVEVQPLFLRCSWVEVYTKVSQNGNTQVKYKLLKCTPKYGTWIIYLQMYIQPLTLQTWYSTETPQTRQTFPIWI